MDIMLNQLLTLVQLKTQLGVKENGGEGVGLFRTEFLYMESAELPTEEQQFEVYKEVLEGMEGKPVVVRTLDIGGDKEIEAIDLPKEMNPFCVFVLFVYVSKEKISLELN